MSPALPPISLSSLLPAALPCVLRSRLLGVIRRDFGENATSGQAICITGFDPKAFILLVNDCEISLGSRARPTTFPFLLRPCNMTPRRARLPTVLIIAGSDSGGGAGLQADLRTVAAHGAHGLVVVTAITAQNTRAVTAIEPVSARMVAAQIDAVFADFRVAAVKIGMLATANIVRTVARELARRPRVPVVLDPVLVATTGARLAREDLTGPLRRHLLSRADLLTPNVPEAESLLGRRLRHERELPAAGADLIAMGARAVLLKGG
ncbi:MAG TPA: bifunctional hydroxymethylpyrimidine kinase/phosphomethylpyrimidine kinase, partial [Rhodanobacteraceae bacterium]